MKTYFTEDELKCPCCWKCEMDKEFLVKLNCARERAMIPFVINSGYRCEKHNAEVGSKSTNHTSGKAVDLQCMISARRYMIVEKLMNVGIMGIGIGPSFIHADINRLYKVLWLYDK